MDHGRFAIEIGKRTVHFWVRLQGLDDGVAQQVRETHLAAAATPEVIVDDNSVVDEQLGGNRANTRRGRDFEAGRHVRHDSGGGPAKN